VWGATTGGRGKWEDPPEAVQLATAAARAVVARDLRKSDESAAGEGWLAAGGQWEGWSPRPQSHWGEDAASFPKS